MIGLVLVTHGNLGAEMLKVLNQVAGPQTQVATIAIMAEDNVDSRRDDLIAKVKEVDSGQGVVLLTDMFGGTPSNLAMSIMDEAKVEVLAGVNLPTLIKLAGVRDNLSLSKAVTEARESGVKYMNVASELLDPK